MAGAGGEGVLNVPSSVFLADIELVRYTGILLLLSRRSEMSGIA